jgi:hypothetical protein
MVPTSASAALALTSLRVAEEPAGTWLAQCVIDV